MRSSYSLHIILDHIVLKKLEMVSECMSFECFGFLKDRSRRHVASASVWRLVTTTLLWWTLCSNLGNYTNVLCCNNDEMESFESRLCGGGSSVCLYSSGAIVVAMSSVVLLSFSRSAIVQ